MPISESLLRARYCNTEFPGCITTDKFECDPRKGHRVEGVCKVCGQTSMFRTESIKTVKSCGCLNNKKAPSRTAVNTSTVTKYKGHTRGNLYFTGEVKKGERRWLLKCQCTVCGCESWFTFETWKGRRAVRCTCKERSQAETVERRYTVGRWDLENIWPAVVKAGREATGAQHG